MEGDVWCAQWNDVCQYISIHALRVEGDRHAGYNITPEEISIHALRVEGDCYGEGDELITVAISIHALRVEGDVLSCFL